MRLQRLIAALAIALCSFSAKADLFDYSYTFDPVDPGTTVAPSFLGVLTVSGSFRGVLAGQSITNVGDVFASLTSSTGGILVAPQSLNAFSYDPDSWSYTTGATLSLDGLSNNFLFADVANPNNTFATFAFGIANFEYSGTYANVWHDGKSWVGATDYEVNNNSWNVSTTPIPEPESYAMLLAGLGLLGFLARRRKHSTAAQSSIQQK